MSKAAKDWATIALMIMAYQWVEREALFTAQRDFLSTLPPEYSGEPEPAPPIDDSVSIYEHNYDDKGLLRIR